MKNSWFLALLPALPLLGCASDRTLETLIPRNSLAVLLVGRPALLAAAWGAGSDALPFVSLDAGKPWAAVAVPANPPGFFLALALANRPEAWAEVETWAQRRGGMMTTRVGTYGVLFSPGMSAPGSLDPVRRFDLTRVRAGGDPVAVYLDFQNVLADSALTGGIHQARFVLPWVEKNLAGLRLGLSRRDGGLEVRLKTDWKSGSETQRVLSNWPVPADLSRWTELLPRSDGLGAVVQLTPQVFGAVGSLIQDPSLRRRWADLTPLIGPRLAAAVTPRADGTWTWAGALESRDPQAVRQALKTLVAGGDLQRNFPSWALDGDTPLLYRDSPDGGGGIRTQVDLGPVRVHLGYGTDRIVLAEGSGTEALHPWEKSPAAPADWFREIPPGAFLVARGSMDGLEAEAAVRVLRDGNLEAGVWIDGSNLKLWEERFPPVAREWLSGVEGWPPMEP